LPSWLAESLSLIEREMETCIWCYKAKSRRGSAQTT